jgi:hypothetical protein
MIDIWDKFENSGRIEDYLAYKEEALGNIYTYDIIKNQYSVPKAEIY